MRAAICAALVAFGSVGVSGFAHAQPAPPRPQDACAVHAPEAARRASLSAETVLRVMHVESRGNPRAVSRKGAIGCMQIMPGTWAYLTRRYRLGADPYHPRMNMIGGALYLAELAGQFGFPGAYSAYNAGPGRYQRYVAHGVPLPAETVAYVTQIGGSGTIAPGRSRLDQPLAARWQEASLFILRGDDWPAATSPVAFAPPATMPASDPSSVGVPGDSIPAAPKAMPTLFPLVGRGEPADR